MIADWTHSAPGALVVSVAILSPIGASAADLPYRGEVVSAPPGLVAGSVVPSHARYDANGYAYYGPTLPYPPLPIHASVGCPLAFQPVYDASGNFAGYGGIRLCE